jgi:excisionase family DNA binding protein
VRRDATPASSSGAVECLWTVADAATFLGVPVATLYQWRHKRIGPPAYRVGRHLRYVPSEVREWLRRSAA